MKTTAKYFCLLLSSCFLIMTTCKKDKDEDGVLRVETYDATEVQGSSAILHGELVSMSTPNLKEFGFIIDTTGTGGRAEYRRVSMGNYLKKPTAFQKTVSSLSKGPAYYFKAYAIDENDMEVIGSEKSFTLAGVSLANFTPHSGAMFDEVVLYGSNFGNVTEIITVTFDDETAEILALGEDSILVKVPKPGTSTHKLSTIRVNINGTVKEYSNKFEYVPLYTIPHNISYYERESAFLISNKIIAYNNSSFTEFDEQSMNWKEDYWYIELNYYIKYCLVLNNYFYTLVTDQMSNNDYYFTKYDLNQKSYITLNYFTDSVYFPMVNNDSPNRSKNKLFSINNYIYQGFVVYVDATPFTDVIYPTNELWKYNVPINSWTQMNDMPDTGMIFAVNNQAYLLNNEHMYQYDATADAWNDLSISTLPQINDPSYRTQFHYEYNNLNYFFNWDSQEIWTFDPSSNTWTFVDNTPISIAEPLMFQRDNLFYIEDESINKAWFYFILEE